MKTDILEVAKGLVERHDVKGFILPSNSGTTARKFFDNFGPEYQYFAVGNPSTSHKKGYVFHKGMSPETKSELESLGIEVALQEVSAFQPMNSPPMFAEHEKNMLSSYERSIGNEVNIKGTALSWIIECTIRALYDEQVKTCVEICLMAGESDKIDPKSKYISVCTPSRWSTEFRDVAVVVNPSTPATFFQNPPHIYEIGYSEKPSP